MATRMTILITNTFILSMTWPLVLLKNDGDLHGGLFIVSESDLKSRSLWLGINFRDSAHDLIFSRISLSLICSYPAIKVCISACILYSFVPDTYVSNESSVSDRRAVASSYSSSSSFLHSMKDRIHNSGISGGRKELTKYSKCCWKGERESNMLENALAKSVSGLESMLLWERESTKLEDALAEAVFGLDSMLLINSDIGFNPLLKDADASSIARELHSMPLISLP